MPQTVNSSERVDLPANLALMMMSRNAPDSQMADISLMHDPSSLALGWRYNNQPMPFDPLMQGMPGFTDAQPYASVDLSRWGIPVALERGFTQGMTPGYWNASARLPAGFNANANRQDNGITNLGISRMLNIMGDQDGGGWQGSLNANATFFPQDIPMKNNFSVMLNLGKDLQP